MDLPNGLGLISVGLHELVNEIVGSETIIGVRRTITNLNNECHMFMETAKDAPFHSYLSGSKGEGFRFSSSDDDYMFIFNDVRVIHSMSQCRLYDVNTTLLLMETEQTRPGFVLLRLIGNANNSDIIRSCVPFQSGIYVSSQKWRDGFSNFPNLSLTIHGPCTSATSSEGEFDFAFCVKSEIFPKSAIGCIRRLHERGWPSPQVLQAIVSGGCHFVAISSKLSDVELLEWRLSFSMAETKLIHAMNHTQFLCYGLLKIFLKEAINVNEDVEGLLCSYYMKTAVFWEIVGNSREWTPSALLSSFWICFQRLIYWVKAENCPNFFVPENNMMLGKFDSTTKTALLCHLMTLYREGYRCLLRCPSLCNALTLIIQAPIIAALPISENEREYSCNIMEDLYTLMEIGNTLPDYVWVDCNNLNITYCDRLVNFTESCTSQFRYSVSRMWLSYLLHALFLQYINYLSDNATVSFGNKLRFPSIKIFLHALKKNRVDIGYHYTAIAIGMYKLGHYEHAITTLNKLKTKLQNPNAMYTWELTPDKYRAAGGENTQLIKMLRTVVAGLVQLKKSESVSELELEHYAQQKNGRSDKIIIPPFVMAHFLTFLSNMKSGNHCGAYAALNDLFVLVHYDSGHHIPEMYRAISWGMLGICQEMMRDYQGAYQSFTTALHQPFNNFYLATEMRLQNLRYNFNN